MEHSFQSVPIKLQWPFYNGRHFNASHRENEQNKTMIAEFHLAASFSGVWFVVRAAGSLVPAYWDTCTEQNHC